MSSSGFHQVLNHVRERAFSERDKGTKFEQLIQAYLYTDPQYANLLNKIWLWNEFPFRRDLGKQETGIDLVAITYDGDYWAIQCKFYGEDSLISKGTVDSFLSTSSRTFKDGSGKTISFSHRLWVSTSNNWGPHANEALRNQIPSVSRINLYDLQEAPVDWARLEKGLFGKDSQAAKKSLYPHQRIAVEDTHKHFAENDRGKLIMACGTGKTFTSLRIAERETDGNGVILVLVPSIALLGQTLRAWSADALEPLNAVCICSDPKISQTKRKKQDLDYFSTVDLALPASTDVPSIVKQMDHIRKSKRQGLTTVFSTYQSIEVISRAQEALLAKDPDYGTFDLIICDEAHRTTGVALTPEDSSDFIKVHDKDFLKARKRLYMTATPRLYSDEAKTKAAEAEAILCSMDEPNIYGQEIYRIGFGEAVERDLLSDYKVLILTLSDKDIPPVIQKQIANSEQEIDFDDATKLIGCINALSKQVWGDDDVMKNVDAEPMKKAVAFCQSIKISKKITQVFNDTTELYINSLPESKRKQMVSVCADHIDGTMNAPRREALMGWLKSGGEKDPNCCHVLSNVRCLSEGVDVPSLDAVMFLSARNSQVDVVQSVGRVMRKSKGKKYGYIIIPVIIPSDADASEALDSNKRYKVVWTVLNALRAHDDRFNAIVNKIELNKKRPPQILVGRPEVSFEDGEAVLCEDESKYTENKQLSHQLRMQFETLQETVFAKLVQKVGDRRYWEQWAQSVAEIAERNVERINRLVKEEGDHRRAFAEFLDGLKKNINPSISEQEAVEMLSQHIITKPVFEALFEGYSFVQSNPISQSMQKMLTLLEDQAIEKDTKSLDKFYASVKKRAEGIDNAEGRQRIVIELYEKFFKTAFPKMVERLGIVYTPVEIVDFIINSVEDVLQEEFGRSLTDENIHILDPFTGTGTFITRLLQSGLINKTDLKRKYQEEIHANEIVLLAYYIAAVNIENAYHDLSGEETFLPFDGICLTDTFQLGETDDSKRLFSDIFPQNSERVQKQKKAPLRVIIGNPPYSIGQKSANDNAQNQEYSKLDHRIAQTYVSCSSANLTRSLYDAYIKAFRWSSDRLDPQHGGVVCFVSNGSWLDGNSQDGFRKCLEREFSSIYVFNLRGNARTQGELRRKEAGNVFGGGSRTPIAITLLVKNPASKAKRARILYRDIGDYLSREKKLSIVKEMGSLVSPDMTLEEIKPNRQDDWFSKRSDLFQTFIPLKAERGKPHQGFFFDVAGPGLNTSRDAWIYSFSKKKLGSRMRKMISVYSQQERKYQFEKETNPDVKPEDCIEANPKLISWSRGLRNSVRSGKVLIFNDNCIRTSLYRPFVRQHVYLDDTLIECPGISSKFFPVKHTDNRVICVSAKSSGFSVLMSDSLTDFHAVGDTQCYPLYYFEPNHDSLFSENRTELHREVISSLIQVKLQAKYGEKIKKEDIFYYIYGLLHSNEYKVEFKSDLSRGLPRIPIVDTLDHFVELCNSGKELAELHLHYETVPHFTDAHVVGDGSSDFRVEKMRFPKKGKKDTIIYNSSIRIENIPPRAYEYVVNGKSAIEWIMDRYQIRTDRASGIVNDPNDWADEVGNPRYILDLLLSIINVSMKTLDIIESLPKLEFPES